MVSWIFLAPQKNIDLSELSWWFEVNIIWFGYMIPTNTPRVVHVETTWCVCRDECLCWAKVSFEWYVLTQLRLKLVKETTHTVETSQWFTVQVNWGLIQIPCSDSLCISLRNSKFWVSQFLNDPWLGDANIGLSKTLQLSLKIMNNKNLLPKGC